MVESNHVQTNDSWIGDFSLCEKEEYADSTSKPGYVFRPQKDWLARMRQGNINSHVNLKKVTLEEVVGELKDDWLVC